MHLIWEKLYPNGKLPGHKREGSFWWRDNLKLLDQFKGLATVNIKDGKTCLLWQDLWGGRVPAFSFTELFSFAKNTSITVHKVRNTTDLSQLFFLLLSDQAFAQLHTLVPLLSDIALQNEPDTWSYIWRNSVFSSARCYKQMVGSANAHPSFRWLWKTSCQHMHKAFFWLLKGPIKHQGTSPKKEYVPTEL